jgi:hypothetical protein
MIYTSQFKSVRKNILYTLTIITAGAATNKVMEPCESPFTTSMDGGDDSTLYKPCKYQSATIKLCTDDYIFDVFAKDAQGSRVLLTKNVDGVEETVWTGYVTPNLYDNGFENEIEEIEIECIDALSTLQYYPYKRVGGVESFLTIINECISRCNAYSKFYISDNTQLAHGASEPLLDRLYIATSNFFDTKSDDETDDDVAMTYQDVLEQICQYLGVTAIAIGDAVWFIDYDAIKAGRYTYYEYFVGATSGTLVTKEVCKTITAEDYSGNGATISLDKIYNKVTVKDSFRKYESVIPGLFDNITNITASTDSDIENSTVAPAGEIVASTLSNGGDKENYNMEAVIDSFAGFFASDGNIVFIKYFSSADYQLYNQKMLQNLNYTITRSSFHGAFIAKIDATRVENAYVNALVNLAKEKEALDKLMAKAGKSSINFSNYVVMLNPGDYHVSNEDTFNNPYLESKNLDSPAFFGGENAGLVISGSFLWHIFDSKPYPISSDEIDLDEGRYAIDAEEAYLDASLIWGGKSWDGTAWQDNITSHFKIPYFDSNSSSGDRRADACMFKDINFVNTVTWRLGTSETGYYIPMPTDNILSGTPKLVLYKPHDPNFHSTKSGSNEGQWYKMNCVFLKDFAIKPIIGDPTFSDANDTDTEYSNVIDNGSVDDLDDIELKICTYDNKTPSYSAVAHKEGDVYSFLDKVFCEAMYDGETGWYSSDSDAPDAKNGMRLEEHLIYRLVNQYQDKSVKLDLNLNDDCNFNSSYVYSGSDLADKIFVADSISYDYANDSAEVNLVEKK